MTIKEISDMYDLSPDTLRFYEKKGLIGPIQRTILKEKISKMQDAYDHLNKKIELYYSGNLDEYLKK